MAIITIDCLLFLLFGLQTGFPNNCLSSNFVFNIIWWIWCTCTRNRHFWGEASSIYIFTHWLYSSYVFLGNAHVPGIFVQKSRGKPISRAIILHFKPSTQKANHRVICQFSWYPVACIISKRGNCREILGYDAFSKWCCLVCLDW